MADPIYFLSPTSPRMGGGGGGSEVFQPGVEEGFGVSISGSDVVIAPGTFWIRRSTRVLEPFYLAAQVTKALPNLPSGSNERLVEVIVTAPGGSELTAADFSVVDGADDAAGTLDNRNGAAHAGASTTRPVISGGELIADVLQTSSTRTLRDRRPWAKGARFTFARVSGNTGGPGGSPTTWGDLDTNLRVRLELSGVPLYARIIGAQGYGMLYYTDGGMSGYLGIRLNSDSPALGANQNIGATRSMSYPEWQDPRASMMRRAGHTAGSYVVAPGLSGGVTVASQLMIPVWEQPEPSTNGSP
jgi:hypothetical protein